MNNRGGEGARLGLPDIDDGFLLRLCEAAAASMAAWSVRIRKTSRLAWVLRNRLMARGPGGARRACAPGTRRGRRSSRPMRCSAPACIAHVDRRAALHRAHLVGRGARRPRCVRAMPAPTSSSKPVRTTSPTTSTGRAATSARSTRRCASPRTARRCGTASSPATSTRSRPITCIATSPPRPAASGRRRPAVPGLETLLPVMLTDGHHGRGLPLGRVAELLASDPAAAMGLARKGRIAVGLDADLAIVDLEPRIRVRPRGRALQRRLFDLRRPDVQGTSGTHPGARPVRGARRRIGRGYGWKRPLRQAGIA